jgi:hypothetical protein
MVSTTAKNIMDSVKDFVTQAEEEEWDTDSMLEAWKKKQSEFETIIKSKPTAVKDEVRALENDPKSIVVENQIDVDNTDTIGNGASYRDGSRNWLYRKFNDCETIVVVMDYPSHAGFTSNDVTTSRLNKIIPYNKYGSYHLVNISIKGWEDDLTELSKVTKKIVVGWGAKRRNMKETQKIRDFIKVYM